MNRAIVVAALLAACNQRDPATAKQATPPPAPAPAPKVAATPPDAGPDVYKVAFDPPPVTDAGSAVVGTGSGGPSRIPLDFPKSNDNAPNGRLTATTKQSFDDTTLTDDQVLAKVMNVYAAGTKRCYKDELKRDPTVRGKLVLTFTVSETGRTKDARAVGLNDSLDACVQQSMTAWRFAVPKDKDGEATEAAFQLTYQLVPD